MKIILRRHQEMTLDLVTLYYTLSIAHSLCQLAVGVPFIESPLV